MEHDSEATSELWERVPKLIIEDCPVRRKRKQQHICWELFIPGHCNSSGSHKSREDLVAKVDV